MEAAFSYMLMLQKYISSKQQTESEIRQYRLCLGNVSKDFTIDNMRKIGLNGVVSILILVNI